MMKCKFSIKKINKNVWLWPIIVEENTMLTDTINNDTCRLIVDDFLSLKIHKLYIIAGTMLSACRSACTRTLGEMELALFWKARVISVSFALWGNEHFRHVHFNITILHAWWGDLGNRYGLIGQLPIVYDIITQHLTWNVKNRHPLNCW